MREKHVVMCQISWILKTVTATLVHLHERDETNIQASYLLV